MEEQTELKEINVPEKTEQQKLIANVINNIEQNNFKIYFYCPAMNTPSGGIGVLFKQAKLLHDNGYKVTIVYEPRVDNKASYVESNKKGKKVEIFERFNPIWLGSTLDGLTIKALGEGVIKFGDNTTEKCEKLMVNAEDFFVIPEGFPNVMQNFMSIPCKKIVLAQSWYYILNSMSSNQNWHQFGIKDVISVSDGITQYLNTIMPGLNIKQFSPSIDRKIFKPKHFTQKYPKIAFMPGRTQDAVLKTFNVIKTFQCFFPQYKWLRFDELKGLEKEEFAERLAESAFVLYTDEIAGFGTLPLEAMACGTHVVGWTPLGGKEYMNKDNGFWAVNGDIFQLAELLGTAVDKYLTGMLDSELVAESYERTLSPYTPEREEQTILTIYKQYVDERITELKQLN